MTAPRVCLMCMYCRSTSALLFCGLTNRETGQDYSCQKWQIGYDGKQLEAEQAQQERIERAKRLAETPVQLDLFEDK